MCWSFTPSLCFCVCVTGLIVGLGFLYVSAARLKTLLSLPSVSVSLEAVVHGAVQSLCGGSVLAQSGGPLLNDTKKKDSFFFFSFINEAAERRLDLLSPTCLPRLLKLIHTLTVKLTGQGGSWFVCCSERAPGLLHIVSVHGTRFISPKFCSEI